MINLVKSFLTHGPLKMELKNLTPKRSVFTFFDLIPFQLTSSVENFEGHLFLSIKQHF